MRDQIAKKPSPDEIVQMLKEGNERFVQGTAIHPNTDAVRLKLAETASQSEHAYATVLCCSDSRVPPERIFDVGVMDIFVVRVAGNVCNANEIGSIEYGLAHVHTPVLVVMGHTGCGAVTAVTHSILGKATTFERNISLMLDGIAPSVRRAMRKRVYLDGDDIIPFAIEENIWKQIENLFMASPDIRSMVKNGLVAVVPAMYELGSGRVNWLSEAKVQYILEHSDSNPDSVY